MTGPKEDAYDEHIAPLVGEIIALCKAHGINAFATFALDPDEDDKPLMCTTCLPIDKGDEHGYALTQKLLDVARPRAQFAAFTITTSKP